MRLYMYRFHKLVTRCYCPTNEVAKRALKAGLQSSQIKIFGLPVRPSFLKAVRPKVCHYDYFAVDLFCIMENNYTLQHQRGLALVASPSLPFRRAEGSSLDCLVEGNMG